MNSLRIRNLIWVENQLSKAVFLGFLLFLIIQNLIHKLAQCSVLLTFLLVMRILTIYRSLADLLGFVAALALLHLQVILNKTTE
jgi:hypothetical protein